MFGASLDMGRAAGRLLGPMWNAGGACGESGHTGIVGKCTRFFGDQEVPRGTPRRSLCASGVEETVLEVQGELRGL